MVGAVGRPRLKPSTVSSSLGVQPRARGSLRPPWRWWRSPWKAGSGAHAFLHVGESWAPLLPRTHLETQGRRSRGHQAWPPLEEVCKAEQTLQFGTVRKGSGKLHKQTNHPSSSRPFPKDAHGRAFGSATLGSMKILNARKLLQFNKSIFLTLC